METPIYVGDQLEAGAHINGPAIIEEATSTLVIHPGASATVSASEAGTTSVISVVTMPGTTPP